MAFFTTDDNNNTEDGLAQQLSELDRRYGAGELTQADYSRRRLELEAQLAFLSVPPKPKLDLEARLRDLEHLHAKHWIPDEDYEAQKKEIMGQL